MKLQSVYQSHENGSRVFLKLLPDSMMETQAKGSGVPVITGNGETDFVWDLSQRTLNVIYVMPSQCFIHFDAEKSFPMLF